MECGPRGLRVGPWTQCLGAHLLFNRFSCRKPSLTAPFWGEVKYLSAGPLLDLVYFSVAVTTQNCSQYFKGSCVLSFGLVLSCFKSSRGTLVAQSAERPPLGFGPGYDVMVHEIEPHVGLWAEHGA